MSLAASLLVVAAVQSQAPETAETTGHAVVPSVRAAPVTGTIHIDAQLDEPAWARAIPATEFTQWDPNEGEPGSERTEVRFLIDDGALYIGARMYDSDPSAIKAALARRDQGVESDLFEVFLDTYHDHLSAFRFRINPAGAIRDAAMSSGGHGDDPSWEPVWDYAARVDSLGWVAEMRIPLSQLRYNSEDDAVWGIQIGRMIRRKGEITFFSFTPKSESAGIDKYGHLVGLGAVRAQKQLEVLPYTLARAEYTEVPDGNPFRDGDDYFGNAGMDLKYGLTSDLTLDASVNPDFGQVEVDPAVVNLTAFETFFAEKRPFFVEGAEVFRFGGIRSFNSYNFPRFFHSRRIGRRPQGDVSGPNVNFADSPEQTTILGAAKVSGRTSGGWSVGLLEALTAREQARYMDSLGVERIAPVEPLANYVVGRVRKDLRSGNSTAGALVTAVHRDLDDPALATLLRSSAYMAGVDFTNAWSNRKWSLDGALVMSAVNGSADAIARIQRSSVRYYQRPDAVRFDSARTSLGGYAYQLSLAKNSGKHYLGSVTYQEVSPGFEVNDLGFQTRADSRAFSWTAGYRETTPGKVLRNWAIYPFTNHTWNFHGDLLFQSYSALGFGQLWNFWHWYLRGDYQPSAFDDRLTRGGPLAKTPTRADFIVDISTDSRKTTVGSGSVFYRWNNEGGFFGSYDLSLSVRPTSATRISIGPSLVKSKNVAQYVRAVSDPVATSTFGTRYVFAKLDLTEVSMVTRIDWTFTPRLSLQLYLQPLISAGDFSELKELAAPRTFDFVEYGVGRGTLTSTDGGFDVTPGDGGADFFVEDSDFNFRSFRANAVLRWEYRPGSTIFLIWQQNRQNVAPVGNFAFGRDIDALFGASGDNILAVKLSYWLGT